MEEIAQYVEKSALSLQQPFRCWQDKAQAIYNHAQVLSSIGRCNDSLEHYEQSFNILKKSIPDQVYRRLFCLVGVQYATTLDCVGKYDKAGDVLALIVEVDPIGCHIGDYALYLHRRKRDFDKAQM